MLNARGKKEIQGNKERSFIKTCTEFNNIIEKSKVFQVFSFKIHQ